MNQFAQIVRVHSYAAGAWRRVPNFDVDLDHDRRRTAQRKEPRPFLTLSLDDQAFVTARIAWREHTQPKQVH